MTSHKYLTFFFSSRANFFYFPTSSKEIKTSSRAKGLVYSFLKSLKINCCYVEKFDTQFKRIENYSEKYFKNFSEREVH